MFRKYKRIVQLNAMKEKLLHIIEKYSEGKLSLDEQIELAEQLADEQNYAAQEILHNDWVNQMETDSIPEKKLNPILDKIHHQIRINEANQASRIIWIRNFQRIAAILILPLLITFLAYFYFQAKPSDTSIAYAEIECPMGARIQFQLPDGSTGNLNSGSKLKYPVQFNGERRVELIGEAFFNVVHNAKSPFHVYTRNLDVKVLGTTFDVIANEDESTEEIILQNGKVDVLSKDGKQLAILIPNEQLSLNIEKRTFSTNKVEASQYTSWKEGKLVFRNENMLQVARRLSRWYNVEVVIDDHQLDDYTFHATFIDEPLDEVLKLLSLTTPLSYKEEKRESDIEGVYQKRKIVLRINQSKIKQFR